MIDGKLLTPEGTLVEHPLKLHRFRGLAIPDTLRGPRTARRHLRHAAYRHVRGLVRADLALTIGYDLSRYDEQSAVDAAAFVIVNVDDPDLGGKIGRAISQAKPWGGYKWIYPGADGHAAAQECAAKLAAFGNAPLGSWADYEDNGVDQSQLVSWFQGLDSVGGRGGYYANDWRVDHAALIAAVGTRWYWTAGYPGDNSGAFPGWDALRTSRPAQLWQFTSTNGTRDQNAVVDQAWYASLGGALTGGFLMALSDAEQQEVLDYIRLMREGAPQFGVPKLLPEIQAIGASVKAAPQFGVDGVAKNAAMIAHDLAGIASLVAGKPSTRALLEAAATGGVPVPAPGDVLTDEEKQELRARSTELRTVADALDALTGP
jgi:hypothetical protein